MKTKRRIILVAVVVATALGVWALLNFDALERMLQSARNDWGRADCVKRGGVWLPPGPDVEWECYSRDAETGEISIRQ